MPETFETLVFTSDSDEDVDERPRLDPLPVQDSQGSPLSVASSASQSAARVASSSSSNPAASATITPLVKTEAEKKKKTKAAIKKDKQSALLKAAKLPMCSVTNSEVNSIQGGKFTRLKSINGVPIMDCSTDFLRRFLAKYRSVGSNKELKRKKPLCDSIVQCFTDYEKKLLKLDENGELLTALDIDADKRHAINRMRYLNVMYSEGIRPRLEEKGKALTKDDLTSGMKQDEGLHRSICREYNDPSKHNEDCHVAVDMPGDAKLNNKPIVWQQSKDFMALLAAAYEEVYRKWKQSGQGGPFHPFIKGNKMKYLNYLFEFDNQYPGFLDKITGKLTGNVFRESIATDSDSSSSSLPSSKKRKRNISGDPDLLEAFESMQESLATKAMAAETSNKILAATHKVHKRKTLIETKEMLQKNIANGRTELGNLFSSAREKSEKSPQELIQSYNEHKQKQQSSASFSMDSFLNNFVGGNGEDSELCRIFDDMYRIEKEVGEWTKVMDQTTKDLDATMATSENMQENVTEIE